MPEAERSAGAHGIDSAAVVKILFPHDFGVSINTARNQVCNIRRLPFRRLPAEPFRDWSALAIMLLRIPDPHLPRRALKLWAADQPGQQPHVGHHDDELHECLGDDDDRRQGVELGPTVRRPTCSLLIVGQTVASFEGSRARAAMVESGAERSVNRREYLRFGRRLTR